MTRNWLGRILITIVAAVAICGHTQTQAQTVNVVEYRNKTLDAYFITGRAKEQALLDTVADFSRTGMSFQATSAASAAAPLTKICRFYVNVTSPYVNSHFYGRQGVDCESLLAANLAGFSYEGYDFALQTPATTTCQVGTTTVYRSFRSLSGGKTSNHRYTVSAASYASAAAAGYVGEGAAFCATTATDATGGATPTAVGVATGSAVSATIGAAGGSLSAADGKLVVTVPSGALAGNTAIGIQPITNFAHGKIGSAYRLTPDGQTFLKPVTLTFAYSDDDLIGASVDMLGAAFQTTTGFWQWTGDATVNAASKTFSMNTSHFSDWSKVKGIQIRPPSKAVRVNGSVGLQVAICYPVSITAPSGDELSSLGYNCDPDNELAILNPVRDWSVNGVLSGSSGTGTVTGSGTTGTYVAPATKPSPATVAVSARVDRSSRSPVQVVSNITITDDSWSGSTVATTEFFRLTADVKWTLLSTNGNVSTYKPSGTASVIDFRCPVTPASAPIGPNDGILMIDNSTNPPTWSAAGATVWTVVHACPAPEVSYSDQVLAIFFGSEAGTVTAAGTTIEGTRVEGPLAIVWRLTRSQ